MSNQAKTVFSKAHLNQLKFSSQHKNCKFLKCFTCIIPSIHSAPTHQQQPTLWERARTTILMRNNQRKSHLKSCPFPLPNQRSVYPWSSFLGEYPPSCRPKQSQQAKTPLFRTISFQMWLQHTPLYKKSVLIFTIFHLLQTTQRFFPSEWQPIA